MGRTTRLLTADISGNAATASNAGGFTKSTVTADTTMAVNYSYVANKSSTPLAFTLPATSSVGDKLEIIGLGSGGWTIVSNASATSQNIRWGSSGAIASSSNAIVLGSSVGQYSSVTLECIVANSEWAVTAYQGFAIGGNYFGTGADGAVTISSNTQLTSTTDGDMVVKNYSSLTINSSCSLTTSNRCKGLLIYVTGDLTLGASASISMTARGASVDPVSAGVNSGGIIIRRAKSGGSSSDSTANQFNGCGTAALNAENNQSAVVNGFVLAIPRTGVAGGAAKTATQHGADGTAGSAGPGGGGSGGAYSSGTSGKGGTSTCFSGGSGGGGVSGSGATAGSDTGGAGGAGGTGVNGAGGGAGNPGGAAAGCCGGYANAGSDGTGGVLIIIVGGNVSIAAGATLSANGSNGGTANAANGGGSGGGVVVLLYKGSYSNSGSLVANGGIGTGGSTYQGGAGGAGYVVASQIL